LGKKKKKRGERTERKTGGSWWVLEIFMMDNSPSCGGE
jgi:hypothetical protein